MTEDWIKPPPPLHSLRPCPPLATERLAQSGAVSFPRAQRTPAEALRRRFAWAAVHAAWWFAIGWAVCHDWGGTP